MKITQEVFKSATGLMKYEDALNHIAVIFKDKKYVATFTYECVCSFKFDVENLTMKDCNISYDKIIVKQDDQTFIWPIQKYTTSIPLEECQQFLESIKR